MYSRNHAVVSALVGVPVAIGAPDGAQLAVWLYMIVVGVGIDADHFVVARLNSGDWTNVRRCLEQPSLLLNGQDAIFDWGDLWRDQRLLSHLVIGGVLVSGLWWIDPYWAFATAVTVYAHCIADLYSDMQTRDDYFAGRV